MSNMSSVATTTVECIALQQQCIDKGCPPNVSSDRVRDKWRNMGIRGERRRRYEQSPDRYQRKSPRSLIVAELTGRTGSDMPQVGEVREYMPCGGSADMNTAQAGEEHWKGDFIFENEWQSFHTKKDQVLKLKTPFHEYNPGRYKIAEKVVDIFGNATIKIIEVSV